MNSIQVLEWSDELLSGHSGMDLTHQEFVSLLEVLRSAPDGEISERLNDLLTHCAEHFSEEQRLMEMYDFPSAECHVNEHAAVHQSITEVASLIDKASQVRVARRLADQLADWFPMHLTHMDSALAHWIIKQIHGGTPVVLRRHIPVTLQALV